MSIRKGLLALLANGPRHGYGLKVAFEAGTGHTWPLNIGQVYSTLQRLERDGAVLAEDGTVEDQHVYRLTEVGRAELDGWFAGPVDADPPPRDELVIKVLLAVVAPDVRVRDVLQAQRVAAVGRLQRLTRLKADADPQRDRAWLLTADRLLLDAEAEVRWLDLCEARLAGAGGDAPMSAGEALDALAPAAGELAGEGPGARKRDAR